MTEPRPYTDKDYKGCYNIKLEERLLILKAASKYKNNRGRMALALEISLSALDYKIIQHGLEV